MPRLFFCWFVAFGFLWALPSFAQLHGQTCFSCARHLSLVLLFYQTSFCCHTFMSNIFSTDVGSIMCYIDLRGFTFVFISRLRVHDQSSNKGHVSLTRIHQKWARILSLRRPCMKSASETKAPRRANWRGFPPLAKPKGENQSLIFAQLCWILGHVIVLFSVTLVLNVFLDSGM